jgi:glucokinase
MTQPSWTIGIDLGGTKMDVGLVDDAGKVLKHQLVPTKAKEGPSAVVDDIVALIKDLLTPEIKKDLLGIGIGIAGQIKKETGLVRFAPNLRWVNFPLQEELSSRTKMPVWVTNDVRAATWGEWLYGAGRGCKDLLCIFVGTGIGGGIVSDGRILAGSTNAAGEIGHMTIDLHGPICSCGNRGCFEAIAGGWAIARRAKELTVTDPSEGKLLLDLAGVEVDHLSAKHVFEAARKGNPLAKMITDEVKEALAAGVAGLVNAFNPECVILGGGIIQANPDLVEVVRREVPQRALKAASTGLRIVQAELKGDAGVIGAAAFAIGNAPAPSKRN